VIFGTLKTQCAHLGSKLGHFWGVLGMVFGVNFGVKNGVKNKPKKGSRKKEVIFGVFGDLQVLAILG